MSDKQLNMLSVRVLSEADIMISKKDPLANQKIADAKKQNKSIETYEEELKGGQKKIDVAEPKGIYVVSPFFLSNCSSRCFDAVVHSLWLS